MDLQQAIDLGLAALDNGEEAAASALLAPIARSNPSSALAWQVLGLLYRGLEDSAGALDALGRAAALSPRDALIANALAQVQLEAGLDATAAFEHTRNLSPTAQATQGYAAALNAAGRRAEAIAVLDQTLDAYPGWGEGHWLISRLHWMAGLRDSYLGTLDRAQSRNPADASLWQVRISIQLRSLDFAGVIRSVPGALRQLGEMPFLRAAEAAALSELGRVGDAEAIFARLGQPLDITDAVYRMRHLLRTGKPQAASDMGERIASQAGAHIWPYLAIAWRLLEDRRWAWLEDQAGLVQRHEIQADLGDIEEISARLRLIHGASQEPLEQSVRGGTQTDGPLLARIEPEIRRLRAAISKAVSNHLQSLPPRDPGHPQLAHRRDRQPRYAGAWSVRLSDGGHHISHVHPEGWFSSALYLALPQGIGPAGNESQSGWLLLGQPDPSLEIDLPPIHAFEPKVGSLVVFPSTMWHRTVPFGQGERMSVAFDVAPPHP